MSSNIKKRFLTQPEENLPRIDLLAIQKDSWEWFTKVGISEALSVISPISDFTGKNWELSLAQYRLGQPPITPTRAREKGLTYSAPLYARATLLNKRTEKTTTQEVFLGDIPQMTLDATFVINGIERAVVNQIVRSPGVYFFGEIDQASGRMLYRGEVRPANGSWLEFEVGKQDVVIARIDRRRKLPATVLLRAMGLEDNERIVEKFRDIDRDPQHSYIEATLAKDPTHTREDALLEIYRRLRPGELAVADNAEALFKSLFFDPRRYNLESVGRYKINKRLGLPAGSEEKDEAQVLSISDFIATLRYLIGLMNGEGRVDDIDHLANRRIRCVGELVSSSAFRPGLLRLERSVKEKMSLTPTDEMVSPGFLVNARPVIAALNEFFRSNQLSVILDQTNPLSEVDNLRRVSVMGQGGITRDRASFSIRDINASQYGRIDPVRSPEGPNIGLVTYLALFVRVNKYGFLEVPYRKVEKVTRLGRTKVRVTKEIVYLPADDEEEYHITHANIRTDKDGSLLDEWVPMRYRGEFTEGPGDLIDLVDLTPRQVVGTSVSLIPFLQHDEANRALMGTNMQCQAVPLVKPVSPSMMTGMEGIVASSMGRVVRAASPGRVVYVDSEKIMVKTTGKPGAVDGDKAIRQGNREIYFLEKFKRTSQSTCFNQRPLVRIGDKVQFSDPIADGAATDGGELALGQNLTVAYCLFEGLGFEDAIAVSDRVVREDLLTSVHIEEYEASIVDTKLGPEELTRDIPNVAEGDLSNLAEDGIVVVGAEVGPNDILVGKIAPKGETELTAEERLLRAIFGEKAREVRDTSLRVPHGEHGIVVDVQILDRKRGDELDPGTLKKVIVQVAQTRKLSVGDKIAGRHGNKGVVSKIVSVADMPHLEDGTPVDVIISPLSVLARMNLGQLLEAQLGRAAEKLDEKFILPVFDRLPQDVIEKIMRQADLPLDGKVQLYDGRTGEPFDQKTFVGNGYIMKLIHMVEDKTHARSTGPYSLVTQQPLGGKAQMGGQRLGEMEVWALEAHRAAYTLQEMLTIKSDDVVGRARAFEAIVKGTEIPAATIPESFKVLVRELNSLGLAIEPEGEVVKPEAAEEATVGLKPPVVAELEPTVAVKG